MTFLLCSAAVICGCSSTEISPSALEFGEPIEFDTKIRATYPTSVVALLGSPASWDGKPVSVEGVIRPDRHGIYLYMTTENCEQQSSYTGVQIYIDEIAPAIYWSDLPNECRYAWIEGVFISTPPDPPQPNAVVIRDRPGLIHAKFVSIY
ncbi:MAG: hypothetical protein GY924_18130 [Planctomycetaceae bacterium]|nr:hypothetical protein [Planctomycetaceae bacterium]